MSSKTRTLISAAVVGAFSWLGISAGSPTLWSPMPLAIVVPVLWVAPIFGSSAGGRWLLLNAFPVVVAVAGFLLWNPQLFRSSAQVPLRSRIGIALLTALDAVFLGIAWEFGVKYQGMEHTVFIAAVNCAAGAVCWAALLNARRRPSFESSLAFHACSAVWAFWLAFP